MQHAFINQIIRIPDIFKQAGFFNEEVVGLIEIGIWSGRVERGVQSAIEFLKLDLS